MKNPLLRIGIVACMLMIAASVAAPALRPTHMLADDRPKIDLDAMVPEQFGDWRIDTSIIPVLPSPDLQAALDKIYNQVLARTYINGQGQRIMLSIAYGGDQSDSMQVHMPEGCYGGQGFVIKSKSKGTMQAGPAELPVSRIVASLGQRTEPVTYWIVVGDKVARTSLEMKMIKLRYALRGVIPEGLLFRVSNITKDADDGYALQQEFANSLMANLNPESRALLFGKTG